MPWMKDGKRDYKREYAKYQGTDEQKKNRAERNRGRAAVAKSRGTTPTKLKGDVAHRRAIDKGGKTTLMNLFLEPASKNRSFSRDSKSNLRSEVSKRESARRR